MSIDMEVAATIGRSGLTGVWVRIADRQYLIAFQDGVELVVSDATNDERTIEQYAFLPDNH